MEHTQTAHTEQSSKLRIELASDADTDAIMALYRSVIGSPGCGWNEHYPALDLLQRDLGDSNIYVMRNSCGVIIATIAIDQDAAVDALPCWTLAPGLSRELARLCVRTDYQNQGLARQMLRFGMDELKSRGYLGTHLLVSAQNPQALACYDKLHFSCVGTADMFGQRWYCYEKQWDPARV